MPGFYKDIQELIDNNPSEPFDYEITKKNIGFFLPDKTELYNLSISKDSTKIIGDIIGFSDGLNIYLKTIRTGVFANFESNKFNEKSNFIKIIDIGVYTFFYDLKKTYNNTTMRSSGGGGASFGYGPPMTSYLPHIINAKTLEIITLNTNKMKKLLADDPDLLEKFKADKKRKKNFEKYITEYNKRYRLKI